MALVALWVPVTLHGVERADAAQRDAARSHRRARAVGAAQVRFLFGLPFAALFLLGLMAATG